MDSPDFDDIDPAAFGDAPATGADSAAGRLVDQAAAGSGVAPDGPDSSDDVDPAAFGAGGAEAPAVDDVAFALASLPPPAGIAQILPADFQLPRLIRFVPDLAVKARLDAAVDHLEKVSVSGLAGLEAADQSMAAVRDCLKATDEVFREAAADADQVHKSITGERARWKSRGLELLEKRGTQVARERKRIDEEEATANRKEQEDANRLERERLAAEAEKQASLGAPAAVVEVMKAQAATAQAAPVSRPVRSSAAAAMSHSTAVEEWKARLQGTLAEADDQQPELKDLTPAQVTSLRAFLLHAATTGQDLGLIAIDWPAAKNRAKADGKTMNVPGFESYKDYSTRAKPKRGSHRSTAGGR
jgi:hypothetical protein